MFSWFQASFVFAHNMYISRFDHNFDLHFYSTKLAQITLYK